MKNDQKPTPPASSQCNTGYWLAGMKKAFLTVTLIFISGGALQAAVPMAANTADSAIGLNTSDQVVFPSGNLNATLFNMGDDSATAGKKDACGVLVFQLPVLAAGELIDTADLTVEMQNLIQAAAVYPLGVDVYGLRYSSSAAVQLTDYGFGASGNAGDTLIMNDIASFNAAVAMTAYSTDAAAGSALASWLNSQYGAGATGGNYVFIRVQPDKSCNNRIDVKTANNTSPPVLSYTILDAGLLANAGPDQSIMDSDDSGAEIVILDGSASGGSAGTITNYAWELESVQIATGVTAQVSLNVGTNLISLAVTDDQGASSTDTVQVIVLPFSNLPPTADAGSDQSVEDSDDSGAETVTLDGSASTDSDGTITNYVWELNASPIATGVTAQVSLNVGTNLVTLTVTDDAGDPDSDTVQIIIQPYNAFSGTTVAIDTNTTYQTIRGYEVLNKLPPFITPELKDEIIETLVNDLGVNRIRCENPAGNGADTYRWEWRNDNGDPDDLDWTKYNFTQMDDVITDMVLPFKTRVEANGEPFDMVVHYSFYPGGSSGDAQAWMYNSPGENAEFAVSLLKRLRDVHGVESTYLCVLNEPTYNNPWTASQIQEIIKVTGPRLEAEGFKTKIEYPEALNVDAAWNNFILPTMNDDEMWSHVGLISYHRYGPETHYANIGAFGLSRNIPVGQTEMGTHDIGKLYDDIARGNCSYWSFYLIQDMIPIYGNDFDRLSYGLWYWRLRQMSHYVRPGAVRVMASSDLSAVEALSFVKDGKVTTVLFTGFDGITRTVRLTGLSPGSYGVSLSKSTASCTELGIQTVDTNQTLEISLPPGSALTVYPYSGVNLPPTVTKNVSSDTFLIAPTNTITLSSSATDPELDAISYHWSVSKAPAGAAVNLATPNAASCAVSGLTVPGTYSFTLEVSDALHTVEREVRTTVYAADPPPLVWNLHNRNPLVVTLPAANTVLRGGAWDMGNTNLTYQWNIVSQPAGASVVLAAPTTTSCAVTSMTVAGDYVFRLGVFDGVNTVTKDLIVPVYPANTAPAINSASASTNALALPNSAITLTATTSDADNDTITHWWRCSAMPTGAHPVFSAQGHPTTQVSGLIVPGTYSFQLTVADETDATTSSLLSVTVGAGASPALLNLHAPLGGETFSLGQTVNIRWTSANFSGDVKLEFYDGSSWSVLSAATTNDGIEAWTVPSSAKSGCLIRISDAADGDPSDESAAPFSIVGSFPKIDADADAMADDWEITNFGSTTHVETSTLAANGMNTMPEAYIAGLDPFDPDAIFAISNAWNILRWNATSGRVYSVYGTTNLLENFQPLETNILWPQNCWTASVDQAEGFYQVNVELAR